MDNKVISSDDLKGDIRSGKIELSEKYDDNVTYQDIIEKDILDLMGFTELTPEKRDHLHQKIQTTLENRVAEQIFDRLSETDRNLYDNLLIEQKNDEAGKFLIDRSIIAEEILSTEALIMKLELYEDSKVVRAEATKVVEKKQGEKDE